MAGLLEGKCAVITGGGRGMGREIALAMGKQGVKVLVNDLGERRTAQAPTIRRRMKWWPR